MRPDRFDDPTIEELREDNVFVSRHRAGYMGTVKADVSICGPYTTQMLIERGWDRDILVEKTGIDLSRYFPTPLSPSQWDILSLQLALQPIPWTDLEPLIDAGVQIIFRNTFPAQEDAP